MSETNEDNTSQAEVKVVSTEVGKGDGEQVEENKVESTKEEEDGSTKKRKADEEDDKEQKEKVSKLSDDVQAATNVGDDGEDSSSTTKTTDTTTTDEPTVTSSNMVPPSTDEAVAAALAKANTSSIAPSEQAKAEVVGTVATTLCLTTSLMPQVIGANGEILMAIKAASSADVTCKLDGAPSPAEFLILITGSFNEVHAAFGLVITYAKNPVAPVYNAKLIITRDDASGLIGKKGSVVQAIRTSLGGGEQYFKINTTQGPTPTVELNGSLEICMQAHYLVHHHLQNQYSRVALRGGPVDQFGTTPTAAGGGGAGDGDNLKLQVDTSKLGNILGRNGARIKAIRAESGARVFIESKDIEPHRSLRWVTVTGTTEQKEFANYLIILAVNEGQIPGVDAAGAQVAATAWASLENTTMQVAAGVVLPALLSQSNGGGGGMAANRAKDSSRYKVALCRNFVNGNCRFGASCDFAHGEHELQAGNRQQSVDPYGGGVYGQGGGAQQLGAYGAMGSGGGYDPANTLIVQVAAHQLGPLFGKGGERIQEMRNHCGAKIVVEDKNIDPGRTMRNVMISGNEAQRQWGNYLVSLAVQTGVDDPGGTFRQGLMAAQAACQQMQQPQYAQQQQQYHHQQQQHYGGGGHYGY